MPNVVERVIQSVSEMQVGGKPFTVQQLGFYGSEAESAKDALKNMNCVQKLSGRKGPYRTNLYTRTMDPATQVEGALEEMRKEHAENPSAILPVIPPDRCRVCVQLAHLHSGCIPIYYQRFEIPLVQRARGEGLIK